MRFGIFLQPLHHPTTDPTFALETDLELLVLLDQLGISEAWIGEHHSSGWENIASPEAMIAVAAERTSNIHFGTGVVQMGLHHPLVTLDRMIFLDHLTKGRVSFGMGVGGGIPSDLTVFGLDQEAAGKRFRESIDVILRLIDGSEPVSAKTDWFELHEAVLQMRPLTQPHMPLAMASGHPDNVRLMGRLGGTVLIGGTPGRVSEIATQLAEGATETGVPAGRGQIRLSYLLHLADTTEEALEGFRAGLISEFYEFQVGVNGRPEPDMTPDEWYDQYAARHVIGSPEDAVSMLAQIEEESGGVGGVIFMNRDWAGIEANRKSWELFASQVAPMFGS